MGLLERKLLAAEDLLKEVEATSLVLGKVDPNNLGHVLVDVGLGLQFPAQLLLEDAEPGRNLTPMEENQGQGQNDGEETRQAAEPGRKRRRAWGRQAPVAGKVFFCGRNPKTIWQLSKREPTG